MLHGGPGFSLSRLIVLRRKIFSCKKKDLQIPLPFLSLSLPPNLLVKASHGSSEMLVCSQKSPGGHPTAITPTLQKHPAKLLTCSGTVAQTANSLHPKPQHCQVGFLAFGHED